MHTLKQWFRHNWFIKLASLVIATLLWIAIAGETSSEIGIEVPLAYRNIPTELEVSGQTTNTVQLRLRGAGNIIEQLSPQDVATTIDLGQTMPGESVFPLTPQNVSVPFGVEVVLINPSRVRVKLERTLSRTVPVTAVLDGAPASGFEVGQVRIVPELIEVHGPESKVAMLESIPTVPVRIEGEQKNIRELVDLDPGESMVRPMYPSPIEVQVEIRPVR